MPQLSIGIVLVPHPIAYVVAVGLMPITDANAVPSWLAGRRFEMVAVD
jgi:hypothetical protein